MASSCTASILLNTMIVGFLSHPSSFNTVFTAPIWLWMTIELMSATWRRRSVFRASSRVALKEETRWWGNFFIKPTVSLNKIFSPFSNLHTLVFVSSVANNLSSTKVSISVKAFINVDFPALVYPTMDTMKNSSRDATSRSCLFSISRNFFLRAWIFFDTMRLSTSSCFSPGPLVPMPPSILERCVHIRVNLGFVYSNWASSTWSFAWNVFARVANMSRINSLLSITFSSMVFSRFLTCAGVRSSSHISTSTSISFAILDNSRAFPFPM